MSSGLNQQVFDDDVIAYDQIKSLLAGLQTAMPCIVESYDPDSLTVSVQPCIQGIERAFDGSIRLVDLPIIADVPVVFQRGGGCSMTFPIQKGDECLVIFASRCIDAWWQSGGVQPPMENRQHDLSDGFAIFAPQSQPTRLKNVSTDSVQIRSDDGQAVIALNPVTYAVSITTSGHIGMAAPTMTLQGALEVTGTLTNNGVNVGSTHIHAGVLNGPGVTAPPQ